MDTGRMIRALMVDVDGVLVSGRPADGAPWASKLARDLGLSSEDLQREFFRPFWREILVGRRRLEDDLAPVLARIAPRLTWEELAAYWFGNDARLNAALLDALAHLREAGVKVFLATNQEHRRAAYLMNELGLARHVDGIFYSAALGFQKPEPAFFEATVAAAGFRPEHLLLIDDMEANVAAARVCGWQAALWTRQTSLADILEAVNEEAGITAI